jgi:hypothetical protein
MAALLKHFFADGENKEFFRGEEVELEEEAVGKVLPSLSLAGRAGGLKYLIHTSPGEGPEILEVKTMLKASDIYG